MPFPGGSSAPDLALTPGAITARPNLQYRFRLTPCSP